MMRALRRLLREAVDPFLDEGVGMLARRGVTVRRSDVGDLLDVFLLGPVDDRLLALAAETRTADHAAALARVLHRQVHTTDPYSSCGMCGRDAVELVRDGVRLLNVPEDGRGSSLPRPQITDARSRADAPGDAGDVNLPLLGDTP